MFVNRLVWFKNETQIFQYNYVLGWAHFLTRKPHLPDLIKLHFQWWAHWYMISRWWFRSLADITGLYTREKSIVSSATGVSRRKLRNETSSNSWENLTKWSGFPGCKIADFHYISPLNYWFSMLFGSSPTQETFPLVRYFQRKIFRRLKQIIRQNTPVPSEKIFHIYGVFRKLVAQHSNRSVLTPI